jgi:VWFA-related protein
LLSQRLKAIPAIPDTYPDTYKESFDKVLPERSQMANRPAIWLLIPIAIGTLRAQKSQPNPEQTVRTFRFAATDARGQPVADLRPDEIRISDAGKRSPVVFLRFVSGPMAKDASVLPHEFTNRVSGEPSASTLILVDLFNADFTESSTACQEIIKTLGQMASPENVFLFLLAPDTSLFPIHSWATPGGTTEPPPGPWTRQISDLLKQGLQTVGKLRHAESTDYNITANLTYQTLKALGAQYAALPGQKRLVWVTRGLPLILIRFSGPSPPQTLLQQTGAEFRQFGIPIYEVHGRGTEDSSLSIASLTGGRSFENEAAARAIAEAQTDAAATYLAGHYPANADADGRFHELGVSTTRKGVRILAPSGYTADPLKEIEQTALGLTVSSAFNTQDIGLRVAIDTTGNTTHFEIHVDPGDLFLQRSGRSQTGKLLLSFVYFNAGGPQIATEPVIVNVNLTSDQFDAAVKNGYPIDVDQTVPAGTSKVRIVVQDAPTGITGSLSVPIASQ